MISPNVDALARAIARPSTRRASLLALGGTGMASIAGGSSARAGKKSKKCKKRSKRKVEKTCRSLEDECLEFLLPLCTEADAPENCEDLVASTCAPLGECQSADAIAGAMELTAWFGGAA